MFFANFNRKWKEKMGKVLSTGSVVRLYNGTVDLTIIGHFPLYEQGGIFDYFDYVACLHLMGVAVLGSMAFDYIYDHKEEIAQGVVDTAQKATKVVGDVADKVGDAISGFGKVLGGHF